MGQDIAHSMSQQFGSTGLLGSDNEAMSDSSPNYMSVSQSDVQSCRV